MAMKPLSLEHWRDYFRTANSDIFDIIDHAIMVAAVDCPKEFRLRRDRIAETLFTCRLTRCSACDGVQLAVPGYEDENQTGCKSRFEMDDDDDDDDFGTGFGCVAGGSKESKVNSTGDDHTEMNINQIASNYSYGEAEALTDEIEEESQIVGEVVRIKEILQNSQDETDSVLFESLRKLQLMALTVDSLKATGIGKAVNRMRKHGSRQIRHLAQTLIDGWTELVDEWVNATKVIAEGTPESVNPSVVDEEEGLPSPPLDEGAFFAAQTTGIELSEFFDGMDDDGNPRNSGEFIKNRNNGRGPPQENQNFTKLKQQTPNDAKDKKTQQLKKQETAMRPSSRPLSTDSGPGRPPKQCTEQKSNNGTKLQQKSDKMTIQKKPLTGQQDKFKCSEEVAVQRKFEASKRKLQESYQQAENAKRQRTIQVMELHDLPKQGLGHKNPHVRPGNHNRHWSNGKR